jgi:hypothetical protein
MYPVNDTLMELMLGDAKGDERIHVQKVLHGKSVSSSRTISLVKVGASGPRSMARNPVTGSFTMRASYFGLLGCVITMRSFSTAISRVSPARRPSLRRIGPGMTILPQNGIFENDVGGSMVPLSCDLLARSRRLAVE